MGKETQTVTNDAKAPDGGPTAIVSKHSPLSVKKAVTLCLGIIFIMLLVATSVLLIAKWASDSKPAFTIEGKSYSKQQYKSMINSAKQHKVPEAQARTKYMEIEKNRYVSESLGIKPTDYQFYRAGVGIDHSKAYKDFDEWQKELTYGEAIAPAIEAGKDGGYSGAIFYFPFGRLMEPLSGAYKGKKPDGYRDPAKIEEDRKYAEQKSKEYYQKIKDGTSESSVIDELLKDQRLVFTGSGNPSKPFMVSVELGQAVQQDAKGAFQVYRDIDATKLKEDKSVGITDMLTGQVILFDLPGKPKKDAYYYFYKIDAFKKADKDLQTKFDNQLKSLKVVVNVK